MLSSSTSQQEEGRSLPEDVILNILCRLPVKSLLRFRSVCRSWNDTIKSQSFITNHLLHHNSVVGNANHQLIVHGCVPETQKEDYYIFSDQTLNETTTYEELDLVLPIFPTSYGPCNGVICLCNGKGRLALWNPATREFRALPKHHPIGFPTKWSPHTNGLGFGLEHPDTSSNGGFKIVWIRNFDRREYSFYGYTLHVAIYTTSTDSWRELPEDAFPHNHNITRQLCNTYINGVYYWWSWREFDRVLAFDMSAETFSEISGPAEISGPGVCRDFCSEYLTTYEDSIALIHERYDGSHARESVSLWVMEEKNRGHPLWIKKWSVGPILNVQNLTGLWKNGHIFMETDTQHLVLYNPDTGETKDIGCFESGNTGIFETLVYKESLVSTRWGQNEHDSSQHVIKCRRNRDDADIRDPDFFEFPAPEYVIYNSDGSGHPVSTLEEYLYAELDKNGSGCCFKICKYFWIKITVFIARKRGQIPWNE